MNRYEQILTRLVVAQVAAGFEPLIAAESGKLRKAAAILETHFQSRELESLKDRAALADLPSILRPQAE
jgi:hypothetical protein